MVAYNMVGASRAGVLYTLATLSALISGVFSELYSWLSIGLVAPLGLMLFGLLVLLFDKYLWKIPFISKITGIPNISGHWKGIGNISHAGNKEENVTDKFVDMEVFVNQT